MVQFMGQTKLLNHRAVCKKPKMNSWGQIDIFRNYLYWIGIL